jgi:sarcosine oxidase, subunit gamma
VAEPGTPARVATQPRPIAHLLHLAADRKPEALRDAARAAAGLDLPPEPGRSARAEGSVAFWLGPGRWLVEATDASAAQALLAACDGPGTVVDVTGGRVALVVAGPGARLLLAAGCPLDLHPRAFPEGAAAATLLAGIPVLLHALQGGIEVYAPRSYAPHLRSWLDHAALTLVA